MAFWITEVPGGFAMGEAADEAEARRMIERAQLQDQASVTWSERAERWRWTVVVDGGKSHHGWADTEADGWAHIREVLNRPTRGTRYRAPRGLWSLPPA